MFKYRGDIAKTGDTSSLRCFFQSNTNTTVVKISKMKVGIHELCKRVNVHDICFVKFGTRVPELCPFLKLLNPYKESLCIKLLQQSSLCFFCFF